jgi:hypothetical protein
MLGSLGKGKGGTQGQFANHIQYRLSAARSPTAYRTAYVQFGKLALYLL